MAVKTSLSAKDLPDNLLALRSAIEQAVPHGRTDNGGRNDRGAWGEIPADVASAWQVLAGELAVIANKHPKIAKANHVNHLGTLGTGNHFIELCLDEAGAVWIMLHSGSRGVGNRIGTYFIERAKADMRRWFINLPDQDLAYIPEGSDMFKDYINAVHWAQEYARSNREVMMAHVVEALRALPAHVLPPFEASL